MEAAGFTGLFKDSVSQLTPLSSLGGAGGGSNDPHRWTWWWIRGIRCI